MRAMGVSIASVLSCVTTFAILIVAAFSDAVEDCCAMCANVIMQCCARRDCRFFCTCVVRALMLFEA